MNGVTIRLATTGDRAGIRLVEERAFGQTAEADLVEHLVAAGDAVLELVAEHGGTLIGHILFSRLAVEMRTARFDAVALAPLAVVPESQRRGIGSALVESAHTRLKAMGEVLSVVLGDPAYYSRFGYRHGRAAGFESDYKSEALQALAWGEAPATGRLVYASAFTTL